MSKPRFTIALAGNPNSGKTTIFNAITGSHQHVGNYPGVTVEKKEGRTEHHGTQLNVVDLPGTYSLTPYSIEEVVARNFVIEQSPDVVIDIIDSSNLERNLYLATQFVELSAPLVLAFNKSDLAAAQGYSIDNKKLSQLLGVPIVPTVAHKGTGIDDLLSAAVAAAQQHDAAVKTQQQPNYGSEIEPHLSQLEDMLAQETDLEAHKRWFAIKLLEDDAETIKRLNKLCGQRAEKILTEARRLRTHIEKVCGDSAEIILADRRYGFISGACTEAVTHTVETRHALSDKIDAVLTNRFVGLPVFAAAMYLVFQITFRLGNPMVEVLDGWMGALADSVRSLAPAGDSLLVSLLADGLIEGVGAVLSFAPLIMLLYLAIAILEDSGYMARAAFILDKLMHKIGLHGKSFIPMLIGFGCTVPAIMATRILETRRDRLTTILVLPLMSCGARLPVYVLILGAFFRPRVLIRLLGVIEVTNQALILFGIYVLGIVLGACCIKIFRATIFRGEVTPFILELPPYRLPALRGLLVHTWERTWQYVKKVGTIILAVVIVLWALKTWPVLPEQQQQQIARQAQAEGQNARAAVYQAKLTYSTIGRLGGFIAPVMKPCGFDWKISTALLGAMAAKEAFIGQMGVVYAVGDDPDGQGQSLTDRLAAAYTPLQGLAIMVFILISAPCMATVAITLRESGSWKWAALQWGYLTVLAWVITTAMYQLASAAGWGSGMVSS